MLNIVIFGAPGSGKGTQSNFLIEKYGLNHVSMGDILRSEIEAKTELGKLAGSYMSKGQLVPDELVIGILGELIHRHPDAKGFVFDGFPRTITQGIALDKMLSDNGTEISIVLSLEVHNEELIDRLLKRGQISGRFDDNRTIIESRLEVYLNHTSPLKEFYDKQGKLKIIDGVGAMKDIFESIAKEINVLIR